MKREKASGQPIMCTPINQTPQPGCILDLKHLIQVDPGLADTLAVLLNDDAMYSIQACKRELQAGRLVPLESVMT